MKTLKQIIGEHSIQFTGNGKDERRFVNKLISDEPFKNMYSDPQYDVLFKGSGVSKYNRRPHHGYNPGEDDKVYEEVLDENKDCHKYHLDSVEKAKEWIEKKKGKVVKIKDSHTKQHYKTYIDHSGGGTAIVYTDKKTGAGNWDNKRV